jgi:uncharacterized RDD family membrane protein YckC
MRLATTGERFIAFAIDSILVTFVASVTKTIWSAFTGFSGGFWFGVSIGTRDWWVVGLFVLYFGWFAIKEQGRTIGKNAVDLSIARPDQATIDQQNLLLREVIKAILLPIAWVSFLLVLFTDDKRALHDILIETRVFRGRIVEPGQTKQKNDDPFDAYYE